MGANMSFNYNKGNDNYKSYGVKAFGTGSYSVDSRKNIPMALGEATVISPVRYRIHLPGIWKRW